MNKTKIEWCDYSWNPITGCKHNCSYCYARKMNMRFHRSFEPQFHEGRLNEPLMLKKPARIFTVSMGDMFGDWVPKAWIEKIFDIVNDCPQHSFQILTKNPKRLPEFCFPKNAWIGVTVDLNNAYRRRLKDLLNSSASIKFISFEPLLTPIDIKSEELKGINWIIIGGKTGHKPFIPPKGWVEKIINAARELEIAVFLKDNLRYPAKIREFPD